MFLNVIYCSDIGNERLPDPAVLEGSGAQAWKVLLQSDWGRGVFIARGAAPLVDLVILGVGQR